MHGVHIAPQCKSETCRSGVYCAIPHRIPAEYIGAGLRSFTFRRMLAISTRRFAAYSQIPRPDGGLEQGFAPKPPMSMPPDFFRTTLDPVICPSYCGNLQSNTGPIRRSQRNAQGTTIAAPNDEPGAGVVQGKTGGLKNCSSGRSINPVVRQPCKPCGFVFRSGRRPSPILSATL